MPYKRVTLMMLGLLMLALPISQIRGQTAVFRIGVLDAEDGAITSGARLAAQQINDAGGVRGADGTIFRLELIVQPPGESADLTPQLQALSSIGVIAALGPETEDAVIANLTGLQALGVPVIIPAEDDPVVANDTSGRLFRMRASEITQARALADYLINVRGERSIATLQLDLASTVGVVGFTTEANRLGVAPAPALLFAVGTTTTDLIETILTANPPVLVTYGDPPLAGEIYSSLRAGGWTGLFAYNLVDDPAFQEIVPLVARGSLIAATTWAAGSGDATSARFSDTYAGFFNTAPGAVEAASYDTVNLIAAAITLPGELGANLAALDNIPGAQGVLTPARLNRGEISANVVITQANAFGGATIMARYAGGQRIETSVVAPPAAALPTATPEGVVATILTQIQNVRSGPGTNFDVIGTLRQGEQARIIGTNVGNTWLVIDYRGLQGWISASLPEIFGDLNTLPIIQPPPTPTPSAPPTATPPPAPVVQPEPDLVVESVSVSPNPIQRNRDFDVTVNIRNAGGSNAGQFAIAATFPPDDLFTSSVIGGLSAGQSIAVTLSGQLEGSTGRYEVAIVLDLNNQVGEGVGENNNIYSLNYRLDERILREGSQRLDNNETLGLEGEGDPDDVRWSDSGDGRLEAINGARIEVLDEDNFSAVFYDDLDPADIDDGSIERADLDDNALVGVMTAEGRRGVLRVDEVREERIDLTFRVYE